MIGRAASYLMITTMVVMAIGFGVPSVLSKSLFPLFGWVKERVIETLPLENVLTNLTGTNITRLAVLIDSDGDGIDDTVDLDDDNDGILDVDENCELPNSALSSTHTFTSSNYANVQGSNNTTKSGNVTISTSLVSGVAGVTNANVISTGNCAAGTPDAGSIDALFSAPVINPVLQFGFGFEFGTEFMDFEILNITNGTPTVTLLGTLSNATLTQISATKYRIQSGANCQNSASCSSGALVQIRGAYFSRIRFTGGSATNNSWCRGVRIGLADAVVQGSCLADTDGDGIPNHLDLDSDNDGCPDAIEGEATFTAANLTSTSALAGSVSSASATFGVPVIAGTGQAIGYSQNAAMNACKDTDGDGIDDTVDLDDDNDGILDTDENSIVLSPACATTPGIQTIVVPVGVTQLPVKLWGAGGGGAYTGADKGGSGAYVSGTIAVTPGETLTLIVGEAGRSKSTANTFGGGGGGGTDPYEGRLGSAGGGMSAIFRGNTPLLIAAGGGGAPASNAASTLSNGGGGGAPNGLDATSNNAPVGANGKGATQSAGGAGGVNPVAGYNGGNGSLYQGGKGGNSSQVNAGAGGGGGGGYYGGGGGAGYGYGPTNQENAGGGGSSYAASSVSGVVMIAGITGGAAPNTMDLVYASTVGYGGTTGVDGGCGYIYIDPIYLNDTDSDGIPNSLDLDSDGDGCPDAIEGGAPFKLTDLSSTSALPGSVSSASATLGVPTIAGMGQSVGYSQNSSVVTCTDSDGDGIVDTDDLDDDNDGILDVDECPQVAPYKVYTYNRSGPGWSTNAPFRITGQTSQTISIDQNALYTDLYYNNVNWKLLASNVVPNGAGQITVSLLPTAATNGSFLAADAVLITNGINTYVIDNSDATGFSTTGTWVSQTVASSYKGNNIYSNTPHTNKSATWQFTTVPMSYTSSSCDLDGDGIANNLDLDSDGDGCPDAIEGGAALTAANLTSTSTVSGSVSSASETLGVPVLAGTGQTIGYSQNASINACTDTDGDGIVDVDDLDDDNDGILDELEVGVTPVCFTNASGLSNASLTGTVGNNNAPTGWSLYGNGGSVDISSGNWAVMSTQTTSALTLFPGTSANTLFIYGQGNGGSGTVGGWAPYGEAFQQTATGLTVGKTYSLSFRGAFTFVNQVPTSVAGVTRPATSRFVLLRDGALVSSSPDINLEAQAQYVTLTFTATATSHTLVIAHTAPKTSDYSLMVIQTGTGLFCDGAVNSDPDMDGDGIPNRLDLDSDGDGCPDAIEGGAVFTAANLSSTSALSGSVSSASATFGIPVVAGSGQTTGYSQNSAINACIDNDNDGITDFEDLDDDNDGILDKEECLTNLVKNGNFANGITDWAASGGWSTTVASAGLIGNIKDAATNETLTQTIQPLSQLQLTGGKLMLTFDISTNDMTNDATKTATVEVLFNGIVYATFTNPTVLATNPTAVASNGATISPAQHPRGSVTSVTMTIPATGLPASAPLTYRFSATGDDYFIGNVRIAAICDADGDGIPNDLDLDSDGDGCPDAIEGTGSFTTSNVTTTGALSGSVSSATATFGVPVLAGTGQQTGYSQSTLVNACTDSDGDGLADLDDLDDDNDGILDTDECKSYSVYIYDYGTGSNMSTNVPYEITGLTTTTLLVNQQAKPYSDLAYGGFNWKQIGSRVTPDPTGNITVKLNLTSSTTGLYVFADAVLVTDGSSYSIIDNATVAGIGGFSFMPSSGWSYQNAANGYQTDNTYSTNPHAGRTATYSFTGLVTACDTDGDGITNNLDLDSDGDGCTDAVEGGNIFTSRDLVNASLPGGNSGSSYIGTVNEPIAQNLGNSVSSTGVPLIAGTGQTVGTSQSMTVLGDGCAEIGEGTIDCGKTQIIPAPVSGTASQHDLLVTVNVTKPGTFALKLSGSGMSLANGINSVTTSTTGLQTFHIPITYNGGPLGVLNFTVGKAGSCSADLTKPPKKALNDVWTIDCIPAAGPALR